ncbi:DUF2062 domain-containing protein [Flavobacterium franklandianum]|uniref:DUF2062 domain-containing protein n=1 Tax=Flavobacterium franklandianum TaxID=2594430 RepID=UPI00117A7A10|nr:DUF2062 domain-containing protein [Flavobacterium franklandianum]TRX30038.1 DUF2062 domain-containing protein [Flavobacterium franklandianum]
MKAILNRAKEKTTALLKQGLTPKQLTQSIIVSGLISTIPILGVSTFMITTVSLKQKLNFPVMISLSYLMWPVQILMIIPFIRVGEFIFSIPQNHHTVEEIISSFQNSFFQTLSHLSFGLLCGLDGWLLTAVPVAVGIYWVSLLFFREKGT